FANKYAAFTGNLLKAAYNYQFTLKDPGGFAHNPTYQIELLYDSIASLNEELSDPVDLSYASRTDPGHFDVTAEAFRHWDADGEVPGTCARCHTSEGLPVYLANGVAIAEEPSNSLACSTCHTSLSEFTLYEVDEVSFPSGASLGFGEGAEANLCLECHQGRESTVSVNAAINRAGVGPNEVSDALSFRNVHYFAAGATLFGSEAQGAYQFDGKDYNGRFMHAEEVETCTDCHRPHSGTFRVNICADCHEDVEEQEDVLLIRMEPEDVEAIDYDGDGDATEPIRDEVMALEEALLAEIQKYAAETIGTPIMYVSYAYPYYYIDGNGNGVIDEGEVNSDTRYSTWTPTLLQAAYNYQYILKDPGVFAHNGDYALQVLYDSIEAIGGPAAVTDYTRPPVR
ncbi:MAG: cytochrome c3 family protein, partial [Anaerolineae bacterium]|nr:cytochrome c3 family protein [Anaerolineae bacterium]